MITSFVVSTIWFSNEIEVYKSFFYFNFIFLTVSKAFLQFSSKFTDNLTKGVVVFEVVGSDIVLSNEKYSLFYVFLAETFDE